VLSRHSLIPLLLTGIAATGATITCQKVVLKGETFWIASAAEPAESPGSPGVVVTDPRLIEQFGGAGFSLNRAGYTRLRAPGPDVQPDAILILVAGFGGGANNFKVLAEELVPKLKADHGLELEVWLFQRRTNQLEDREGAVLAIQLGDPQIALDWYYGGELGLTLHPFLTRRAHFYNTSNDIPFVANWTSQTFSLDIDAVVEAARAVAKNDNVFLGGHSAGTGFTARYAATDFDLAGTGSPDPGFAKLRGLVLLEGGGGSANTAPLSEDSLDRIEAKFDGGQYAAVRDQDGRCVDGTTACSIATEAADCGGLTPPVCTPATDAYTGLLGGPGLLAAAEVVAIQSGSVEDPDDVKAIVFEDQGAVGNNAAAVVPDLAQLGLALQVLGAPPTVHALFGVFLDDEGLGALLSPAVATGLGKIGTNVAGLRRWLDISEPQAADADNGPPPTTGSAVWGQEVEAVEIDRLISTFTAWTENAADWYFATSGLAVTSASGLCDTVGGVCTAGNVGAVCVDDGDCGQSIGLDSSQLSLDPPAGRGRRDIVNLTQAGEIDIPVICFGGSNGLTPVPARYLAFAESIGACTTPTCDGSTPRVVDPVTPSEAFPTYGGVAGGYEVYISEGFAHNDVVTAEQVPENRIVGPLADFIARNAE
jgi:pimeloyl-ACP methyl ester carboxylesterase